MKTVLITGASQGIGYHTAERLAKEGYNVIASARNPEKYLKLQQLAKSYPNLKVIKLDVRDTEDNINEIVRNLSPIDILINNAGIGLVGAVESFSIKQIQEVLDTNVLGVMKVTHAVLPGMRQAKSGLILTISSIVGPIPDMRQPIYSGSKAMIEHITAVLRQNLREFNIQVANIHPGPVLTNFEAATPKGNRFTEQNNPYPEMKKEIEDWRTLMKEGRPVEETVETILNVIRSKKPQFWNSTEPRVASNFANIYVDPTGEKFAQGPSFKAKAAQASDISFFGKNVPKTKEELMNFYMEAKL